MLNRQILFERLAKHETDSTVLWLIQIILFNEPTQNCRFREARRCDFERLPAHKTLFKTANDCGLPIGNLTSQFFANVYLWEKNYIMLSKMLSKCFSEVV